MPRVLHLLSQRPGLTGSGITLEALVSHARQKGWEQRVVVGVPEHGRQVSVGGLEKTCIRPIVFGAGELDFDIPGMSDVMPYPSTRFSTMTFSQMKRYQSNLIQRVSPLIRDFCPDIIHSHHIWILSSLIKDMAPRIPVVAQCHATGLRQMSLCPHLARKVIEGCRKIERFLVLHNEHAEQIAKLLEIPKDRIHVVGAGFNDALFHHRDRSAHNRHLIYIGKYSASKGLPYLLDAVERIADRYSDLQLHVAGSGSGPEAASLKRRMKSMAPLVTLHDQLTQSELSDLMRRCSVCILPSLYEGVPLVLVEAYACGLRIVTTRLPGVMDQLSPYIGSSLELVPLPRLRDVDVPLQQDLPVFVDNLARAIESSLETPPIDTRSPNLEQALERFTWKTVFERVEAVWNELII